jgi:FOG: GAF domain
MEDQFRLERLNRVYAMLGHSNEAIARVRDPERLFAEICHIVVNEGGFDAAWIGQANANGQIAVLARVGLDDDALARLDLSLAGVSPAARALRAGTTQLDDQAMETRPIDRSPEDAATGATHPSSAAFPVLIDDEPRIVLHIHAQDKHRFDDQHIELFARLAGNLGIALELAAARAAELNAVTSGCA